jgi:hypothetical protein
LLALLGSGVTHSFAQTSDSKDYQVAKKVLQLRERQLDSIITWIKVSSTHRMSPTAKAVYDFVVAYVDSVATGGGAGGHIILDNGHSKPPQDSLAFVSTATVTAAVADGAGKSTVTMTVPNSGITATQLATGAVTAVKLNQMGATTNQVIRWNGSAWAPDGINMYAVVTTSQTVSSSTNQVFVNTLSSAITLNMPACNASNDRVSFQFFKSGADNNAVHIEPAGSEKFNDTSSSKTLYSQGTNLICTCRWTGSSGSWFFSNM